MNGLRHFANQEAEELPSVFTSEDVDSTLLFNNRTNS